MEESKLKKALTPIGLWAIAVGAVISGMYYGWNYIFASTNFLGAVIALVIATLFYVTFMFLYAELATMTPSSAGPAAYAERAFGRGTGFFAGFCYLVESLFATPGICISVGAYVHNMFPAVPAVIAAVGIYIIFLLINCAGIEAAAKVGVIVTAIGVAGVLLFSAIGFPSVKASNIANMGDLGGIKGIFLAIPYAVWFYLAIEACGMGAEETRNPSKDIPKAYISSVFTLLVCAVLMLVVMAGALPKAEIIGTDAPMAIVITKLFGADSAWNIIFIIIALFGLCASLHGIIIGQSRQAYCLARCKCLPSYLAKLDKNGTPINSLITTSVIGMIFVLIGSVDAIVVISGLGSALMAVFCVISWFKLRKSEPNAKRPYACKVVTGIICAIFCAIVTISTIYSSLTQGVLFYIAIGFFALAILYYFLVCNKRKGSFIVESADDN